HGVTIEALVVGERQLGALAQPIAQPGEGRLQNGVVTTVAHAPAYLRSSSVSPACSHSPVISLPRPASKPTLIGLSCCSIATTPANAASGRCTWTMPSVW